MSSRDPHPSEVIRQSGNILGLASALDLDFWIVAGALANTGLRLQKDSIGVPARAMELLPQHVNGNGKQKRKAT